MNGIILSDIWCLGYITHTYQTFCTRNSQSVTHESNDQEIEVDQLDNSSQTSHHSGDIDRGLDDSSPELIDFDDFDNDTEAVLQRSLELDLDDLIDDICWAVAHLHDPTRAFQ